MSEKSVKRFCTLIVEDSPIFREILTDIIRNRFPTIEIETVGDGNLVMDSVDRHQPDIILMDIKLPAVDGITLTKYIKQKDESQKIIILSNHDMPEYRQAAIRHGADEFISKGASSCMEDVLGHLERSIEQSYLQSNTLH